jgi:hypothetical protein
LIKNKAIGKKTIIDIEEKKGFLEIDVILLLPYVQLGWNQHLISYEVMGILLTDDCLLEAGITGVIAVVTRMRPKLLQLVTLLA